MPALAIALLVAGCVQSGRTGGYGGTTPSGISPDPYHYRCTGNCQAG